MAKLIDANVMLRFLLNDDKEMANKATAVISEGAFTKEAVIAEVLYVLKNVYKLERKAISDLLSSLLEVVQIENRDVVLFALRLYEQRSLDFVDCLLIGYNAVQNVDVFSFDKKLNNLLNK